MRAEFLGIGMTSQRTRERLAARMAELGIRNRQVLNAIRSLPRHIFVDEALASRAYEETSLPIGNGQTLSQPFVVARMTEILLEVSPRRVLEVGTGSGYQTAVLASLVEKVYSIERIATLQALARGRLWDLKLNNVTLKHGDGYAGWPEHAPFHGILVAAAPPEVPQALLQQLADGGRLVLPVGVSGGQQQLYSITRRGDTFIQQALDKVTFVPMLGGTQSSGGFR